MGDCLSKLRGQDGKSIEKRDEKYRADEVSGDEESPHVPAAKGNGFSNIAKEETKSSKPKQEKSAPG